MLGNSGDETHHEKIPLKTYFQRCSIILPAVCFQRCSNVYNAAQRAFNVAQRAFNGLGDIYIYVLGGIGGYIYIYIYWRIARLFLYLLINFLVVA